ncbi:MAG TPA: PIN domain-containing protein, partial [bacterium]
DFQKAYDATQLEGIRENMRAETGMTDEAIKQRSSLLAMDKLACPVLILHGSVELTGLTRVCKDPDDNKFLETAVIGRADFLVAKNLKHFPRKKYESVRIVSVATFLRSLKKPEFDRLC